MSARDYATASNGDIIQGASEYSPLLRSNGQISYSSRVRRHMTENLSNSYGDFVLLSCYIVTGLLDSSAVFIWGSFVSMQTGNTVYLGLGLVEPTESTRWIKSLISISCFCLGSLCFSSFHRHFSPRKRWVLLASFGTQILFIVIAAGITMLAPVDGPHELHWHVLVPLTLVAFQSSGQAVTSRALQFNSLTSVVLTSIYCDLFSDSKLFTTGITKNAERNRRAAAPILLLLGVVFGGLFSKSSFGIAGALWTAAGLKGCIFIAWLLWKAEPKTDEEEG